MGEKCVKKLWRGSWNILFRSEKLRNKLEKEGKSELEKLREGVRRYEILQKTTVEQGENLSIVEGEGAKHKNVEKVGIQRELGCGARDAACPENTWGNARQWRVGRCAELRGANRNTQK